MSLPTPRDLGGRTSGLVSPLRGIALLKSLTDIRMDGWTYGRIDEHMNGLTDRHMDGHTDRRTDTLLDDRTATRVPAYFKTWNLSTFLVACTRLYNPLCPLVGRSVGWSVGHTLLFLLILFL